jgi:hypothetical protein
MPGECRREDRSRKPDWRWICLSISSDVADLGESLDGRFLLRSLWNRNQRRSNGLLVDLGHRSCQSFGPGSQASMRARCEVPTPRIGYRSRLRQRGVESGDQEAHRPRRKAGLIV